MNDDDTVIAVVLRQTQWLLDDVAFALPRDRVTEEKGQELAEILEDLAKLVRRRTASAS